MKSIRWICMAAALLGSMASQAASPSGLINYQGVLRDTSGVPLEGSHDMVFRFFDAASGSDNEILVDTHDAANLNPVSVGGGVFNVELGGGTQSDGSGPGTYSTLASVFRDFDEVWMSVVIDGDLLSPRARVIASAYSLNSDHLDGQDSAAFGLRDSSNTWTAANTFSDPSNSFSGNGGGLTALDASNLSTGTLPAAQLPSGVARTFLSHTWTGTNAFTNVSNSFIGNGSGLTGLNASNLAAGTVSDSRLSSNVPLENAANTWSATNTFQAPLLFSAGSAGAPGMAISVDTDTGLFRGATNRLSIATAGIERVRVNGSGLSTSVPLHTGSITSTTAYNRLGSSATTGHAGDISTIDDTVIGDDLEVNGLLFVDGDSIFFANGTTKSLKWDNPETRFEFTNSLLVAGVINAGNSVSSVAYHRFGGGTGDSPTSGDITNASDVYIQRDLEVRNSIYAGAIASSSSASPLSITSGAGLQFVLDPDADSQGDGRFEWIGNGSRKIAELDMDGNFRLEGPMSGSQGHDVAEFFPTTDSLLPGELVALTPGGNGSVRRTSGEGDSLTVGVVSTRPGFLLGDAPFDEERLNEVPGGEMHQEFLQAEPRLRGELAQESKYASLFSRRESLDAQLTSAPAEDLIQQGVEQIDRLLREAALKRFWSERFVPVAIAGRVPVKADASFGAIRAGDLLAPSPVPGVAQRARSAGPVVGTALGDLAEGQGMVLCFVHRGHYTPADISLTGDRAAMIEQQVEARTPDPETGRQEMTGNLQIVLDRDANERSRFSVFRDGGTGLDEELLRLDEDGDLHVKGAIKPASMDLAEYYPVSETVGVGDVLVLDPERPGRLRRGSEPDDPAVVGIVSGNPGVVLGSGLMPIARANPEISARLEQARAAGDAGTEADLWAELEATFEATHAPIALSGLVPCKVDAAWGAIKPGDLLVTSPTAGHAMRAHDPAPGTIIGKAFDSLETGTGTIRVLVMLR